MSESVQISVPIADVPEAGQFMHEQLDTSSFTQEAKKVLARLYSGMRATETTLASGAAVNSTARVFQKLVELVAEAESE